MKSTLAERTYRRGGLYIRPNRVRCVPGPGGCGSWAGRIYNAPLQSRRTHHRRRCSVGADAHIGPPGTGMKSTLAERTYRRGGLYIRPNRVRCVPGPGGCGSWAGRIFNAPLQQEWQRVRPARAARTHSPAGRCGHRPLREDRKRVRPSFCESFGAASMLRQPHVFCWEGITAR